MRSIFAKPGNPGTSLRTLSALIGVTALTAAGVVSSAQAAPTAPAADSRPACAPPSGPPPQTTPTTVDVMGEAYRCILTNYYSGSVLDDRTLLTGAFAGLTRELERRGTDMSRATLPALSGNRDADWAAFARLVKQILDAAPAGARQALAEATVNGMVAALDDNHAHWEHPDGPPPPMPGPGYSYGLGFQTNPSVPLIDTAAAEALGPLAVASVQGGPAAAAGLRLGDVIEAVDGAPPFIDGAVSVPAVDLLHGDYPAAQPVTLTLRRPSTGRVWTVSLTPEVFKPVPGADSPVAARLLPDGMAYVSIAGFVPGVADQALAAIRALGGQTRVRGVVLDLRGNGGGAPAEVARLLGAFEHVRPYAFDCDVSGSCVPLLPDATVPLLRLPEAVLTDRNCASACDAFTAAVKDLGLGAVIGTRTSGMVAGAAGGYVLGDGSLLMMPAKHQLAARHETINGIGVAPDYFIPLTAADLSAGRDPALDKAVEVLGGRRR
ncbi:MAG: peptidase [Catenulispora sp.]|nr:peptidase [Catenulispora sp.]